MDDVQIRPARLSDLYQLVSLYEALWPKSSAEEHAQELRLILGGKAVLVLTMPHTNFAEASDGTLLGFLEVAYARMRTVATRHNPWAISRGGTFARETGRVV